MKKRQASLIHLLSRGERADPAFAQPETKQLLNNYNSFSSSPSTFLFPRKLKNTLYPI